MPQLIYVVLTRVGRGQPTASDVSKSLLCRLRTECHRVKELPVCPFRRGIFYCCALHFNNQLLLFAPQRMDGLNRRCPARRQKTGDKRKGAECNCGSRKHQWIRIADVVQQMRKVSAA